MSKKCKSDCELTDKICNPVSGRCVTKSGKIGKALVKRKSSPHRRKSSKLEVSPLISPKTIINPPIISPHLKSPSPVSQLSNFFTRRAGPDVTNLIEEFADPCKMAMLSGHKCKPFITNFTNTKTGKTLPCTLYCMKHCEPEQFLPLLTWDLIPDKVEILLYNGKTIVKNIIKVGTTIIIQRKQSHDNFRSIFTNVSDNVWNNVISKSYSRSNPVQLSSFQVAEKLCNDIKYNDGIDLMSFYIYLNFLPNPLLFNSQIAKFKFNKPYFQPEQIWKFEGTTIIIEKEISTSFFRND